jgi:hypothetical protein
MVTAADRREARCAATAIAAPRAQGRQGVDDVVGADVGIQDAAVAALAARLAGERRAGRDVPLGDW